MAGSAPSGGYLSTVDFGQTPGLKSNREDLIDVVVNVDLKKTPLLSIIGKTVAKHTTHEWQEEQLTDPAANLGGGVSLTSGVVEGADFLADTMTVPVRRQNFCQIFRRDIQLTGSQIEGNPAGIRDMFGHEVAKAMPEVMRAIERRCFAVQPTVGGTQTGNTRLMKTLDYDNATGGAGTATALGLIQAYTVGSLSNIKDYVTSTSLAEADLLDVIQTCAELGGETSDIFCSYPIKRRISKNFVGYGSTSAPLQRTTDQNTVVVAFDWYETDFGKARITASPWVTKMVDTMGGVTFAGTNLAGRLFVLQRNLIKWAWYRPLQSQLMGKRGDSIAGIVVGEGCIEVQSTKAHGKVKALADT